MERTKKALEGAKFKLKKTADTRDLYYKVNESTKEVTWVEKKKEQQKLRQKSELMEKQLLL